MIESHKILNQSTQSDGKLRTQVAFTDHLGTNHNRSYDFPEGSQVNDEIAIRQVSVDAGLKDQDIQKALSRIERGDTFKLDFASPAELKTRLQEVEIQKQDEIGRLIVEKTNISAKVG